MIICLENTLDTKIQTICLKNWTTQKTQKNNIQAALINSALTDFKNRINRMSENEIRFEQPNEIVNIVEKILEFNRQQSGQGLKILTQIKCLIDYQLL